MRNFLKTTIAAAALLGSAAVMGTPAAAQSLGITIGGHGTAITFSTENGGYCDRYGCPDAFWDDPVYDCPVFWHGDWYRGPLYYRRAHGELWFWIHGDWQRDQWRGPRPAGYCVDQFRPALGFEWYEDHGFHMRDEWVDRWHHDHPDQWQHWHDHHGGMDHGMDHHDNMMGGHSMDHHDNMMGGDHHDNDHHDNIHHDNMMGGDHHDHGNGGGDHHDKGKSGSGSSGSGSSGNDHHHDDNGHH